MPFGQVNNYNGRFFFPFNTVCRFFSYSIRAIYIFGDLILLLSRKQKKNFSWFHVFIQKKRPADFFSTMRMFNEHKHTYEEGPCGQLTVLHY